MKVSLIFLLKATIFTGLAIFSFNAFALCDTVYVGNPNRPYTMWEPGCWSGNCYREGHYVKFLETSHCENCGTFTWQDDRLVYSRPMVVVGKMDTF